MKKTFDTLAWIRGVRDGQYRQQQGLSAEEKIKQSQAAAERFRASRPGRRAPNPPQE